MPNKNTSEDFKRRREQARQKVGTTRRQKRLGRKRLKERLVDHTLDFIEMSEPTTRD